MVAVEENAVVEIDYSTYSMEQVLEAIGKAYKAKDMKLMGTLSKLYTKKEAEEEKLKKEALQAELAKLTISIQALFNRLARYLTSGHSPEKDDLDKFTIILSRLTGKELDGADGIWFANDFDEKATVMRLTKAAKKVAGEGASSGKSSYVANPAKSADLLAKVGENVFFKEDTEVKIDKQDYTIPAGTTFKEAYDFSTNGGWRNRVRMALLKEAGVI